MSRSEIVQILVEHGHSADKALSIAIDYERGDCWARQWVAAIQSPDFPLKRTIKVSMGKGK